jgi:hypothetical protein
VAVRAAVVDCRALGRRLLDRERLAMTRFYLAVLGALALASPALAQVQANVDQQSPGSSRWSLQDSDKVFLISQQAQTMAPMTFRVGTVDQLQTVQSLGTGYVADVFADFAPLSWLQLGVTVNYGTVGDPALQNILAPTLYVQAQFLHQETAGVNMAGALNFKKIGFAEPTEDHPNDGELEAWLLVDRRVGRFGLTANGVFGKSFSVPDSDAELKLSAAYFLRRNLAVGLDSITRYDTSFDGGPKDGTRYWELTGGPMATWKLADFTLAGLGGLTAPMHAPAPGTPGPGIGPIGMLQLTYSVK